MALFHEQEKERKKRILLFLALIYYIAVAVVASSMNFIRDENSTALSIYNAMDY